MTNLMGTGTSTHDMDNLLEGTGTSSEAVLERTGTPTQALTTEESSSHEATSYKDRHANDLPFWSEFWYRPWQHLNESWLKILPIESLELVGTVAPRFLRVWLELDDCAMPKRDEQTLRWLKLSLDRQNLVALLLVEIVRKGASHGQLAAPDEEWCRHLAKALRPGLWLNEAILNTDPEVLLCLVIRQFVAQELWQRLRVTLPHRAVQTAELLANEPLPRNRINQLWQSVLWRAEQSQ
ncbi:hypothetical protein [Vibrio porteresiae]|uniref:Type III secretion protein HrpD n=1 Tax=Vibrio porteresiae DSM 19223 TaxID=1123496 RepID=A0ABZ0QD68_9VIBR|nr:hypothetical protein [Vibrio porteresiae]WPC73473.1 hypothetical protein R8Z52_15345 [Vibrio porteresiae DSM 19223]